MANRHDSSHDEASRSNTRRSQGRSPYQERFRDQSLSPEESVSISSRHKHYTSEAPVSPTLEDRIRRIEESQNKILQLLQEARQPARERQYERSSGKRKNISENTNQPAQKRKIDQRKTQDFSQPRRDPQPKKEYTLLNTSRTNILRNIQDIKNMRWPQLLKPGSGNQEQYCHFHRSRGHTTEKCKQLQEEIERLIRQGYLGRFVRKSTNPPEECSCWGARKQSSGNMENLPN